MGQIPKLLLGALTILPLAWSGYMLVFALRFVLQVFEGNGAIGDEQVTELQQLMTVHFGVAALAIALLVFYCVHCVRNQRLAETPRIVWLIALVLLGVIAMPVYFVLQIWPDQQVSDRTRGRH